MTSVQKQMAEQQAQVPSAQASEAVAWSAQMKSESRAGEAEALADAPAQVKKTKKENKVEREHSPRKQQNPKMYNQSILKNQKPKPRQVSPAHRERSPRKVVPPLKVYDEPVKQSSKREPCPEQPNKKVYDGPVKQKAKPHASANAKPVIVSTPEEISEAPRPRAQRPRASASAKPVIVSKPEEISDEAPPPKAKRPRASATAKPVIVSKPEEMPLNLKTKPRAIPSATRPKPLKPRNAPELRKRPAEPTPVFPYQFTEERMAKESKRVTLPIAKPAQPKPTFLPSGSVNAKQPRNKQLLRTTASQCHSIQHPHHQSPLLWQ